MVGSVLQVRYELVQALPDGPIFTTYAARDLHNGGEVCVRLIQPPFSDDPLLISTIRDVVQRYAGIDHLGLERMKEVEDEAGAPFLVTEFTPGVPLADRIRKLAPFSVSVAVSTILSLCEGLDALHAAGLPHGDVSGTTAVAQPDGQIRLQLPGMWEVYAATPLAAGLVLPLMAPYLAPELSAGESPSPTSDVYAVGVILYELLAGRLPYNADTPVSMALKHATGTTPSVRMFNQSVPVVLDEIVKKAMAKEPALRYASAGDLLADLRVVQDALRFGKTVTWPIRPDRESIESKPMPKTAPVRKATPKAPEATPSRRERGDVPTFLVGAILFFGALFLAIAGVVLYLNLNEPPLVKVPSLRGLTIDEARRAIGAAKVRLEIEARRPDDNILAEHIIASTPNAGQSVRERGVITIVMSTGSRFVEVPDLSGISVDQARSTLKDLRLQLDDDIQQENSSDVDPGMVIRQSPRKGRKVEQTSKVQIVVSKGPSDSVPTGDPNGDGQARLYTLEVKLTGLDSAVTVRVDMQDAHSLRTIYEQYHQPGETISLPVRGTGREVTFFIYYDNELVKTVKKSADAGAPVRPSDEGVPE